MPHIPRMLFNNGKESRSCVPLLTAHFADILQLLYSMELQNDFRSSGTRTLAPLVAGNALPLALDFVKKKRTEFKKMKYIKH
jgi:hypothetical protein